MTGSDFSKPSSSFRTTAELEAAWVSLLDDLSLIYALFIFTCDTVDDEERDENLIDAVTSLMRYGNQQYSEVARMPMPLMDKLLRGINRHVSREYSSSGSDDD